VAVLAEALVAALELGLLAAPLVRHVYFLDLRGVYF